MMVRHKNIKLLHRTTELTRLLKKSADLGVFLNDLAHLIADHMEADSCSFFIYDRDHDELLLQGTVGLPESCVGTLRLKSGEGITGTVIKTLHPIKADHAQQHPKFKEIPGVTEGDFKSILAVPIRRGSLRIGVITLHKREASYFSVKDVTILMAIASQIASSVLSAGFFLSLKRAPVSLEDIKSPIKGVGASSGIVQGLSMVYNRQQFFYPGSSSESKQQQEAVEEDQQSHSIKDFDEAIEKTLEQLKQIEDHLGESLSDIAGLIFTAHYLMLKDPNYTGVMRNMIEEGMSVSSAIRSVTDEYANLIAATDNPRIQEKEQDVRDLEHRLLTNLYHRDTEHSDYSDYVIIASAIYPSELIRFWVQKAKGIILYGQGLTAHISILSRSLNIPLMLVKNRDAMRIPNGTRIIADTTEGTIHIDPDAALISLYEQIAKKKQAPVPKDLPEHSYTTDGRNVQVYVNVNILHDAQAGFDRKAEGIGLYRSEFPFLIQNDFPSEDQQLQVYEKVCETAGDRVIMLRTLDIGGDKLPGYVEALSEENPFLGFRGIRYSLETPDIFFEQIRAMLRAGAGKKLRLLFPMVSSLEEFLRAKQAVFSCMQQLEEEGLEYCEAPKLGAMIEVPAAVEIAADLAEEADFLSIGTNDLIMYLIAVDRGNDRVGDMHTAYHPAVLRTLKRLTDAVLSVREDPDGYLSVCGDAAGDHQLLPFFIGIGIYNFSVEPSRLVEMKQLIATISYEDCVNYANGLLQARTASEIENLIAESCPCRSSE